LLLLTLRGTPVLFQGDELGLVDTDVPHDQMKDPLGLLYYPAYRGRDGARTPMPWRDGPGAGFTGADVAPWLPFGDLAGWNVEDQRGDAGSTLHLARRLIGLRRSEPDLHAGGYRSIDAGSGVWAYQRGKRMVVVAGMTDREASLNGIDGTVVAATNPDRIGEQVAGSVPVRGWEALVVRTRGGDSEAQP